MTTTFAHGEALSTWLSLPQIGTWNSTQGAMMSGDILSNRITPSSGETVEGKQLAVVLLEVKEEALVFEIFEKCYVELKGNGVQELIPESCLNF